MSTYYGNVTYKENMNSHLLLPWTSTSSIKNEKLKAVFGSSYSADNLLADIDADDIQELKKYFFLNNITKDDSVKLSTFHCTDDTGIALNKEEFVNAIEQIYGKKHLNTSASIYFEKLQNKKTIKDSIKWCQLLDSIIDQYKEKTDKKYEPTKPLLQCIKNHTLSHAKDPILQILALETDKTFCFVIIHYTGSIQVYSNEMTLCHAYTIPLSPGLMRRTRWISSAISSSEGTFIFVATSDRYFYIYETKRLIHSLKFIISGLPNVISCQEYQNFINDQKSILLLGDESGNTHVMIFHQTSKSFFKESQDKEITNYTWREIKKQEKWVTLITDHNVHDDYVMQIVYIQENDTVISFSPDPLASVVIKQREGNTLVYKIKLNKSLKCFDIDTKLGLMATSASEPFICLWNSSTPSSPIIKLYGHDKNIFDICFLRQNTSVLTLSEDGILKVWNLENFKCQQTINFERCFRQGEIYFFKHRISRRYTENISAHSIQDITNRERLVTNIYVINGSEITNLLINDLEKSQHTKKIPEKNLEPAIPGPDIVLKNYNREHPFKLQHLFGNGNKRGITEEKTIKLSMASSFINQTQLKQIPRTEFPEGLVREMIRQQMQYVDVFLKIDFLIQRVVTILVVAR